MTASLTEAVKASADPHDMHCSIRTRGICDCGWLPFVSEALPYAAALELRGILAALERGETALAIVELRRMLQE